MKRVYCVMSGTGYIYDIFESKNNAEKETLFKICLATRMERQEALEFLNYFGYCFSKEGVNPVDDLMSELLSKHIYGIAEVNKYFVERIKRPLFK